MDSSLLLTTMGNASSKAARKLPKRTITPSWTESGIQSSGAVPLAKEQKDQGEQANYIASFSRTDVGT